MIACGSDSLLTYLENNGEQALTDLFNTVGLKAAEKYIEKKTITGGKTDQELIRIFDVIKDFEMDIGGDLVSKISISSDLEQIMLYSTTSAKIFMKS